MYDLKWSHDVLQAFRLKHSAGVARLCKLYQLSDEFVVELVADGGVRWRGFKSLAKHLEDSMQSYEKGYRLSRDFGSNYYTFDKYLRQALKRRLFPGQLDLLDSEIMIDYSSEAQRRDGEGRRCVDPLQPSLFPSQGV